MCFLIPHIQGYFVHLLPIPTVPHIIFFSFSWKIHPSHCLISSDVFPVAIQIRTSQTGAVNQTNKVVQHTSQHEYVVYIFLIHTQWGFGHLQEVALFQDNLGTLLQYFRYELRKQPFVQRRNFPMTKRYDDELYSVMYLNLDDPSRRHACIEIDFTVVAR